MGHGRLRSGVRLTTVKACSRTGTVPPTTTNFQLPTQDAALRRQVSLAAGHHQLTDGDNRTPSRRLAYIDSRAPQPRRHAAACKESIPRSDAPITRRNKAQHRAAQRSTAQHGAGHGRSRGRSRGRTWQDMAGHGRTWQHCTSIQAGPRMLAADRRQPDRIPRSVSSAIFSCNGPQKTSHHLDQASIQQQGGHAAGRDDLGESCPTSG